MIGKERKLTVNPLINPLINTIDLPLQLLRVKIHPTFPIPSAFNTLKPLIKYPQNLATLIIHDCSLLFIPENGDRVSSFVVRLGFMVQVFDVG